MRTKLEVLQDTLEQLTDLYLIAGNGEGADEQVDEIIARVDDIVENIGQEIANEHANN